MSLVGVGARSPDAPRLCAVAAVRGQMGVPERPRARNRRCFAPNPP
ncbi:hypothetical protein NY78_3038 [Desulfovibrio sp. TomC]|nr:hypothetical protein NY78_3038 [Desulfovibrio sp. TomC]